MLIDDIKLSLRSNNTIEVQDLIDAAKLDLLISGVLNQDETDALIKRAITVYCKAHYGYDNNEAERFEKSYSMLKSHLTLSQDYSYYKIIFTVNQNQATVTFNDEVKLTNSIGVAAFTIKDKDNVNYSVYKDGYVTQEGLIDITASTSIAITMVVV